MKKWLIGILLLTIIFSTGLLFAQNHLHPFSRETLTVGQTPVILTAATYGTLAWAALLSTEGTIIYTLNGTDPTTDGVGHVLRGGQLLLGQYELRNIKMISLSTINNSEVQVTYYAR